MATYRGSSARDLVLQGVVGGIIAGMVFAIAEMVMAAVMGMDFLAPLQLISSIALGSVALTPGYSLTTAVATGLVVHLILSAIYGIVFVYLLHVVGQLNLQPVLLLLYGTIYGFALWVLNFLIIAPAAFPQFGMADPFWMGFVAHTFFFGTTLGSYLAATRAGVAEVR